MSLIAELKRRNVFKVGAAYLALAWVVLQATGAIVPALNLPATLVPTVVWIGVIGFPCVLIFSWAYELTPEGLKRESEVDRSQSITHVTSKRLDYIIIGMLAVAMVLYGWGRWGADEAPLTGVTSGPDAPAQAAVSAPTTPPPSATLHTTPTAAHTPAAPAEAAVAPQPPERSIAVLPFANLSGDPDNEYFSDGISEEILNVLARTPELQVAARTSSFAFKGKTEDIADIAKALRVRLVLEGSVRRQGERVRITAQLIDAAPGYHLWSQTYDRDLKDIFAIQDEIARAIGAEMKVRLTGVDESGKTQRGTTHIAAYDAYLRGLALWQTRRDQALWDAVAAFESAIALDPEFAQAFGGLAMTYSVLSDYTLRITQAEATTRGLDTAERALARDPLLPEAYAALGNFAAFEGRFHTAIDLLRRAIALRPSFATGHQFLLFPLESSGDLDGAIRSARHALALDPRSEIIANNLSQILMFAGRNAEAIAVCQQTLGFSPDSALCLEAMAQGHLLQGDLAAARLHFDRWAAVWGHGSAQVAEVFDALAGHGDRGLAAQRLAATNRLDAYDPAREILLQEPQIPVVLIMLGENGLALDWIERQTNAGNYTGWGLGQPALDPIRCEPRFVAAQRKMKRVDPRAPTVCASKS